MFGIYVTLVWNDDISSRFCFCLFQDFHFQESYTIWFLFMLHMYKIISLGFFFFHFLKILVFQIVSWAKQQKIFQIDKKFCLSSFISQEAYIPWFLFLVNMCKTMTSPDVFFSFFFRNFDFPGCYVGRIAKNGSKWRKLLSNRTSYDCGFCHKCVKWWHLQVFFSSFQNFDFPGC